jgi:hypothetical protein
VTTRKRRAAAPQAGAVHNPEGWPVYTVTFKDGTSIQQPGKTEEHARQAAWQFRPEVAESCELND